MSVATDDAIEEILLLVTQKIKDQGNASVAAVLLILALVIALKKSRQ